LSDVVQPAPLDPIDRRAVSAATLAAGLMIAQQVAARATRDALFLESFRVSSLPAVMMASAVVALVGAEALSRALARRSPLRVLPRTAALSALLLIAEWVTALVAPRVAAVIVYLHVAAFGGALISAFWSLVNERFDPYTARRAIGRIGTGAALGGVAGGGVAWALARLLPVSGALPALAALHALAAATILLLRPHGEAVATPARGPETLDGALTIVARAPYLGALALVVGLSAFVDALLDFLFKAHAVMVFARGGELLSVFALFHAGVSVLGVALQAALTRPALGRLGIAGTVALRPALTAVGAVLGGAIPRFSTATFARGAHECLGNSLFRSGYELLYTPLPEAEKRRVKALIDVAVDKAGALVGSAVVLAAVSLVPGETDRPLFLLAALVSLATLALTPRLQAGYVGALERSLLAGRVKLDPAEVVDSATRMTITQTGLLGDRDSLLRQIEALRGPSPEGATPPTTAPPPAAVAPGPDADPLLRALADLRSGDPPRIRRAIREQREPEPVIAAQVIPLLASGELFPEALRALRRAAPWITGQLVDALLDPRTDPVVRRRIPRVLKTSPTQRAAEGLLAALQDESFDVRNAAALALAALTDRSAALTVPRGDVFALARLALEDPRNGERALPHVFTLLALTLEREPLRVSWAALNGSDPRLRGTALEYLENVLPEDLRRPLWERLGAQSAAAPARPKAEVVDELLHSSVGLRLERPPWRGPDEA